MKNYFSSACSVADTIICYYCIRKMQLSLLRLQHLLYRLYEDYYENFGELLFPENFYTSVKGPEIKEIYICYSDEDLDTMKNKYYTSEEAAAIIPLLKKYDDALISELLFYNCGENSPYLLAGGYESDREKLIPPALIREHIDKIKKQTNERDGCKEWFTRGLAGSGSDFECKEDKMMLEEENLAIESLRVKYESPLKISYSRFGIISDVALKRVLELELTGIDYKIFFLLLSCVEPITGAVYNSKGEPITKEMICGSINKSEKTVRISLQALQNNELIKKIEDNNCAKYYVNPYVFVKNPKINEYLYGIFKDSIWHKYYLKRHTN